jgi:hypothetical protein
MVVSKHHHKMYCVRLSASCCCALDQQETHWQRVCCALCFALSLTDPGGRVTAQLPGNPVMLLLLPAVTPAQTHCCMHHPVPEETSYCQQLCSGTMQRSPQLAASSS